MRDYLEIVRRNFLSPIVIAIFLLAAALLYVREYRDAWFISVVIVVNSLIGVVQEIRAKRVLKKLELMSAPRARKVGKNGEITEVMSDDLQPGDVILLRAGDEIPADGRVVESKALEVNEGMLTGESVAVEKLAEAQIWAATTVIAGEAKVEILAVGKNTKAGMIGKTLKRYSPELTPLQRAIQNAITFLTYGAIALSALIFATNFFAGNQIATILKTIVSAAVTVVPEGLLLASSLLLAFGSLRLAQAKVLPQKLSAIEAMALMNLLCVDKTGTLTSDTIALEKVQSFDKKYDNRELADFAAIVARETSGGNPTGRAILKAFESPREAEIAEVLAFSSARKFAGARFVLGEKNRAIIMGAPEFVAKFAKIDSHAKKQLGTWTEQGLRVLLLAEMPSDLPLKKLAKNSGWAIGAVILRNSLRPGVVETVKFLQEQGVSIRVISGDNPHTVEFIARAAGIENSERVITGEKLAQLDDSEFAAAAKNYTIFARVLPEQKERLIACFREAGFFTGMVGDGVNDALALKKANIGVAMQAGAPISRRVSDLILLDNSFTSLPIGMRLGNRIMQAIEVISTLFFHKIIYGLVLLFATMLLGMAYPYAPRHITFMNIFLVTMPTLMWTLFPPTPRHRVNPQHFWRDTLGAVAPIAVITGLAVAFTYWILNRTHAGSPPEISTITVLTATFFGVYLVFLAGPMLGVALDRRAAVARTIYIAAVVIVATLSFGVGFLRNFFDFSAPNVLILWPAVGVIVIAALVQWQIARRAGRKFINVNKKK